MRPPRLKFPGSQEAIANKRLSKIEPEVAFSRCFDFGPYMVHYIYSFIGTKIEIYSKKRLRVRISKNVSWDSWRFLRAGKIQPWTPGFFINSEFFIRRDEKLFTCMPLIRSVYLEWNPCHMSLGSGEHIVEWFLLHQYMRDGHRRCDVHMVQ